MDVNTIEAIEDLEVSEVGEITVKRQKSEIFRVATFICLPLNYVSRSPRVFILRHSTIQTDPFSFKKLPHITYIKTFCSLKMNSL